MIILCFALEDKETVDAKFFALFLTVSKKRPSSDPLITRQSTPNCLHNAFATVVFPTPGNPNKSFVVESWDEVQEYWWNNCRSPLFEGTVIEVIDKPKKKSKGFK